MIVQERRSSDFKCLIPDYYHGVVGKVSESKIFAVSYKEIDKVQVSTE